MDKLEKQVKEFDTETKSWKTTTLGILAIIATILNAITALLGGKPLDIPVTALGLTTGAGLIAARDHSAGVAK